MSCTSKVTYLTVSDRDKDREIDSYLSSYLDRAHARIVDIPNPVEKRRSSLSEYDKSHGNSDYSVLFPIMDAYYDVFNRPIPKSYLSFVIEYLNKGLYVAVVVDVIQRTADAPRPAWAYTRAVLTRCFDDGVRTPADMAARDQRRRSAAAPAKSSKSSFNDMDSREIDEHYYDDVFVNLAVPRA